MQSKFNLHKLDLRAIVATIAVLIFGIVAGTGIGINVAPEGDVVVETTAAEYSIELSETQVPALVENADGEIEEILAPTVETIDAEQAFSDEEIPDFGKGAWRDMSSPDAYKNNVIGQHIDFDGKYGEQCVDPFAEFHYNYTGRWLSTNSTGAAYGLWDARDYNAGSDYDLITDVSQLKPGAWAVFGGGQYGHVGMVVGYPNNGYIALLGENQGGAPGVNGGAAVNIINISLKNFRGAFFPKMWVVPEPEAPATDSVSDCTTYHVQAGDTLSKIMLECEGAVSYGEDMDEYAATWYSTTVRSDQSVYYGWTHGTGYGLYAGDIIERRAGN